MPRVIYKYQLFTERETQSVLMPRGARPLFVAYQQRYELQVERQPLQTDPHLWLWAEVDTEYGDVPRRIVIRATGEFFEDPPPGVERLKLGREDADRAFGRYIGSVVNPQDASVWHVYDKGTVSP